MGIYPPILGGCAASAALNMIRCLGSLVVLYGVGGVVFQAFER